MDRHSHFQVAGMIGATENPLAKNTETATERRIFSGKAGSRADVRQIENELVNRISFVFERSGDGQTFASLEEREERAASGRRSIFSDEAQLSPCVGGRIRDERRQIVLQFRARPTNERDSFALGRLEERAPVRINHRGNFNFGKIDARIDRIAASSDLGGSAASKVGNQGNDEFVKARFRQGPPDSRELAPIRRSETAATEESFLRNHFTGAIASSATIVASGISRP